MSTGRRATRRGPPSPRLIGPQRCAKSLYILDQLGVLVRETGRTDKNARAAFYPFSVSIKVTPLTPAPHPRADQHGQPCGVYLPGDVFSIDSRR